MTGSYIKNIRKKRGLTQEQLAEQIGYSQGAISNIEKKGIDIDLLLMIVHALDIDISDMLANNNIKPQKPSSTIQDINRNRISTINSLSTSTKDFHYAITSELIKRECSIVRDVYKCITKDINMLKIRSQVKKSINNKLRQSYKKYIQKNYKNSKESR